MSWQEGVTGLLGDERDVEGMATHMLTLIGNRALCGELGRNAAAHVRRYYTMEQSIGRLARILRAAASRHSIDAVRVSIESELPVVPSQATPEQAAGALH